MNTQWNHAAIFQVRRRGSVTDEVADHLRRRIVSGDLPVASRLPSIRTMARLYGVSVPTMFAAVHVVAGLGLLHVSHGIGTFVARPRSHAALLNHACQTATPFELAVLRATIDATIPGIAARQMKLLPPNRLPRTLLDLSFLAMERSAARNGYAEGLLRADAAFHCAIAASVRGAEITVSLYQRLHQRLVPTLRSVADVEAADLDLDTAHSRLARAILDGEERMASRLARGIARRELASLNDNLG